MVLMQFKGAFHGEISYANKSSSSPSRSNNDINQKHSADRITGDSSIQISRACRYKRKKRSKEVSQFLSIEYAVSGYPSAKTVALILLIRGI